MRPCLLLISFLLFSGPDCNAGNIQGLTPMDDTIPRAEARWVDSVYQSLDTNQRIAQLLVIRAFSTRDQKYADSLTEVIESLNIGGLCFFKGTPTAQASLTNCWQTRVKTPLLVAIDAEWGMGMRLDSAFDFPYQMTLGAIGEDSLVYRMASQIALDCRRIGVQINLAPVVDINNNPDNPVINLRSFGEDKRNVIRKGVLYMKGLQDNGVLSTGKHFPGHGDTDTDSHLSLPLISQSASRLDSVELAPFNALIKAGAGGIMIAHLYIPAYETTPDLPSTLSKPIVTGLLKQKMGFTGYVITDALDMKGVTKYFPSGQIEVMALEAGNDLLLLPKDAHLAVKSMREAADSGILSWQLLESKCKSILKLKFQLGLADLKPIQTEHLTADLNPRASVVLNEELFRASATIVRNENRLLPLTLLDKRKIVLISVGDTERTGFQERLSWYFPATCITVRPDAKQTMLDSILGGIKDFDIAIVGIHHANLFPKDRFGISSNLVSFIDSIPKQNRAVLALFGNPYILGILRHPDDYAAILTTYQDRPESEEAAAEIVAGGSGGKGRLPVSAGGFKAGTGFFTETTRIGWTCPETFGIPDAMLTKVDSLALDGIRTGAYPGCEILLAKNGKIFYYKSFGSPIYGDTGAVRNNDLYDLASVTKMAGTTLAVMKLFEEGQIGLDEPIGTYLPLLRNTSKGGLTLREILSHQAGLQAWIPFYQATITDGKPDTAIYSHSFSASYPVRVSEALYIKACYRDTILQQIIRSGMGKRGEYKYSDLGFYLLEAMVSHLTGEPLDVYLDRKFYRPMGLTTMGFNPLRRFPAARIMPTEKDTLWRHALLRGDVHDPGAAMLGGVAGHAGLFSDAFDLSVIMQMLLNYGEYGGKQYLLPSTIREFTRVQYPGTNNRRGLGFDKPPVDYIPDGPSCRSASPASFGHSGFTGTYAWADPENQLIYIFLSNRVYPNASNNKLSEKNIRTNLHQAVYDMLEEVSGK